ncbi:MAG: phosphate signaling complex protein PhoU [Bacteroidia bacterium]
MTLLEVELNKLKTEIISMWDLVISQLNKAQQALVSFDKDLAMEVIANEKRVNGMELKIDRDGESIMALFNPVAVDLRFVMAMLKINYNLERTGDIAKGICKCIVNSDKPFDEKLLDDSQVLVMFEEATDMLEDVLTAFKNEDTAIARTIFKRDKYLDDINKKIDLAITVYISANPNNVAQSLYIHSSIRKIERAGDQAKNIAEELIFYVEAKVLKHQSKKNIE